MLQHCLTKCMQTKPEALSRKILTDQAHLETPTLTPQTVWQNQLRRATRAASAAATKSNAEIAANPSGRSCESEEDGDRNKALQGKRRRNVKTFSNKSEDETTGSFCKEILIYLDQLPSETALLLLLRQGGFGGTSCHRSVSTSAVRKISFRSLVSACTGPGCGVKREICPVMGMNLTKNSWPRTKYG